MAGDPQLSCCNGGVKMDLPFLTQLQPSAPWHYPVSADPNYFQCDRADHGGGQSKQCSTPNYAAGSACIGPPSASRSAVLVHNSTDCTASGGLCTCKSFNLTGFPSGSPGVQCSPAGDADGRPISIDSHDVSGRTTAENGVTSNASFVIAINRKDATDWNSHIIENRLVCTSPVITWAASSRTYDAAFKCNVAGRYEISSHPAIGPDTGDPIGTTTITLVPQQADPSSTLAFLANQKAEWCTGASD